MRRQPVVIRDYGDKLIVPYEDYFTVVDKVVIILDDNRKIEIVNGGITKVKLMDKSKKSPDVKLISDGNIVHLFFKNE